MDLIHTRTNNLECWFDSKRVGCVSYGVSEFAYDVESGPAGGPQNHQQGVAYQISICCNHVIVTAPTRHIKCVSLGNSPSQLTLAFYLSYSSTSFSVSRPKCGIQAPRIRTAALHLFHC